MTLCVHSPLEAQESPVDYATEIQPIFDSSCAGSGCHIGEKTYGIELTSYHSVVTSVGFVYEGPTVVPFDAAGSPLHDKIAHTKPDFGKQMPRGREPLSQRQIELVARWIDEGARRTTLQHQRGDVNASKRLDMTDAILLVVHLFLEGFSPYCEPVGDVNGDGVINPDDPIYLLRYLFLAGPRLPDLTLEEQTSCDQANNPPSIQPIGTIHGREGVPLEFQLVANDPDGDRLSFSADSSPEGLEIDKSTGVVRWAPVFGQKGDHRIALRVKDQGVPPLSVITTGLIRIAKGNSSPVVSESGIVYGRELIPVAFHIHATDPDGDSLAFSLLEGPTGSTLDPKTGTFEWTPALKQDGEHRLRVRVSDDGTPPRSTEREVRLVIISQGSLVNQRPTIPRHDIIRITPGYEVRIPIGAEDPDSHGIQYTASKLPDGARLDTSTGVLTWRPEEDQLGPFSVPFTVTDDGVPPESIEDTLILKVMPPDPCVDLDCDPRTGCVASLKPLDEECCEEEPVVRVAEPVSDCTKVGALFLGRNEVKFGRLQNCDRLNLRAGGQGGTTIRMNVEARCINTEERVSLHLRIQTRDEVLVDQGLTAKLRVRHDGFAQRLGLSFQLKPGISARSLEGEPALVTATLTDADGITLETSLRVVLTLQDLEDLPNPDVPDVPGDESGCIGCHRPLTPTGERVGIEDPHPWFQLKCTDCHGGNSSERTREFAHEASLEDPKFLRDLSSDQLDGVSKRYLQFVNPGDMRVAARGCGSQNPASAGTGCHQDKVESLPLSVMGTFAGHYTLPRFLAGSQDREAIYAAVDIENPHFNSETAPPGALAFMKALREPEPDVDRSSTAACMDVYLPKACPTCHLNDFGPNDASGNYRSSGCTGCHMLYNDDGLSRSEDPVISKDFPPHPAKHVLTSAMPVEQCSRCHFQGGRIGLSFRGIREGGFGPEKTPENGVTLGVPLHAHGPDYYFEDEDSTNNVDETPPDLHFAAGMVCVDCHVGGDVHGDGNLYASERDQLGIRCEDCHGTVRAEVEEDPEDGRFKNSKGFWLKRVRRDDADRVMLKLATQDRELEIPQIHRILESGVNLAMTEAMGVDEKGFSHTDKLECYSCHTSWRQTCFGCHITVDDSQSSTNRTTGKVSKGAFFVERDDFSLDFFALGVNRRGKISPLCSSMSVFMSYIDENGEQQYRDRVRTSADGRKGFGWNPFHHHTVSRVPQNCDRCHRTAPEAGSENTSTLRETYGFGNGKFVVEDGDGDRHDLSAFLDDNGDLIGEFPHAGTGPVPKEIRERAMSIEVVPHPRD